MHVSRFARNLACVTAKFIQAFFDLKLIWIWSGFGFSFLMYPYISVCIILRSNFDSYLPCLWFGSLQMVTLIASRYTSLRRLLQNMHNFVSYVYLMFSYVLVTYGLQQIMLNVPESMRTVHLQLTLSCADSPLRLCPFICFGLLV